MSYYSQLPPSAPIVPGPQSFSPASPTAKVIAAGINQAKPTIAMTTPTAFTPITAPTPATHSKALLAAHPTLSPTNTRHY